MKMNNIKYEITEDSGFPRVKLKYNTILLLPFTYVEDKIEIFFIKENFPFRGENAYSVLTGTLEEGVNLIDNIKRELLEESGFDIENEIERIYDIGYFYTNKWSNEKYYCFAINVNNLKRSEPQGDGSKKESNIEVVKKDLEKIYTECGLVNSAIVLFIKNLNNILK
jgi:8-oxo-dGTP pyrophosphatase MutT (NUDIX family)